MREERKIRPKDRDSSSKDRSDSRFDERWENFMIPKSILEKPKINHDEQKEKEAAMPINKDGLKFYEKKT